MAFRSLRLTLAALGVSLLLMAPAATAVELIESISGSTDPTLIYTGPVPPGSLPASEWHMENAPTKGVIIIGESGTKWYIAFNVTFQPKADWDWTGGALTSDDSTGNVANGLFSAGSTLTVTGKIYDHPVLGTGHLLYDGVIMEGTVSSFRMKETAPQSGYPADVDDLNSRDAAGTGRMTIDWTDGYLTSNGTLEFADVDYWFDWSVLKANGMGSLDDFQATHSAAVSPQFTFEIPEPATVLLLGAGSALLLRRRRG